MEQDYERGLRYNSQETKNAMGDNAAAKEESARKFKLALGDLDQEMNSRGLTNSGASVQTESNRLGALQGAFTTADTMKNKELSDIATQRTSLEQAYQQDLASANAGLEANKLQSLMAKQEQMQASDIANVSQYSNDYQAEINKRMATNPNDPLIPYLKVARQNKISNLGSSMQDVGQYSNDFQDRINFLEQTNPTDPTLPYLKQAREQKIATMIEAQQKISEQEREVAFDLFDKLGKANSYIAQTLGIPQGTTTMDYNKMLYTINKPYPRTTTGGTSEEEII
jgi:rubrerythrin